MYGIIKSPYKFTRLPEMEVIMIRQSTKKEATKKIYLYGRLSNEDKKHGDSYSILNQRKILSRYADDNGFSGWEFIFDDGYSGGDWERPAFKQMIDEVFESAGVDKFFTEQDNYELQYAENGQIYNILQTKHKGHNKNEYIEYIMKKYNLEPSEILFVGNAKNDEQAYKAGVETLCLNPDRTDHTNKTIWTNAVEKTDSLKVVLDFVIENHQSMLN